MHTTIRPLLPRIIIGIAFFVFGFIVAHALDLGLRDIVGGLLAGTVGGLTMLVVVLGTKTELHPDLKARLAGNARIEQE